jgi:hypothetical protein
VGEPPTTGGGWCRHGSLAVGPSPRGSLTISPTSAAVPAVPTQNLGKCQIPLHPRTEFWRGPEPNLAWLAHRMGTERNLHVNLSDGAKGTALRAEASSPRFDGDDWRPTIVSMRFCIADPKSPCQCSGECIGPEIGYERTWAASVPTIEFPAQFTLYPGFPLNRLTPPVPRPRGSIIAASSPDIQQAIGTDPSHTAHTAQ